MQGTHDPGHRARDSWGPWRAGGDRWPHTSHRPSQSGGSCPTLQKLVKIHLADACLLLVWMLPRMFEMVVEVKQMSTKDRSERKKYTGVCRWESELTARMRSRFPNTVIRYMERKSPNMTGWHSGSSENTRRMNTEICVSFPGSMWLDWLPEERKNH